LDCNSTQIHIPLADGTHAEVGDNTATTPGWDGIYQDQLRHVLANGTRIEPTKGPCLDLIGHSFVLADPRDRIIYNPARDFDLLGAMGQWLWTMAGRMEFESIRYYNSKADRFSVDKFRMHGAYGPRLFGIGVFNQIPRLIEMVQEKNWTRRAVATVYSPEFDTFRVKEGAVEDEVPCTIAIQFFPRGDKMEAMTFMRSQNAAGLLPLDVFLFTLLQEYVACSAGYGVGPYHHAAGSFHIYEKARPMVDNYIAAKIENPRPLLPAMTKKDQSQNLMAVLRQEEALRVQAVTAGIEKGRRKFDATKFLAFADEQEPFWKAVVEILLARAAIEAGDKELMRTMMERTTPAARVFLQREYAKHFEKTLLQFDFSLKEK
jgi:thymidylate synthase